MPRLGCRRPREPSPPGRADGDDDVWEALARRLLRYAMRRYIDSTQTTSRHEAATAPRRRDAEPDLQDVIKPLLRQLVAFLARSYLREESHRRRHHRHRHHKQQQDGRQGDDEGDDARPRRERGDGPEAAPPVFTAADLEKLETDLADILATVRRAAGTVQPTTRRPGEATSLPKLTDDGERAREDDLGTAREEDGDVAAPGEESQSSESDDEGKGGDGPAPTTPTAPS